MPELSKIRKNDVDYDIKDATARREIETLKQNSGSGGKAELDTTLTQSGKAADAKAVGDALDELERKIPLDGAANTLHGKKILAIGDSFVKGHTLSEDKTWVSKIAARNNMTKYVYATNGVSLAQASGQSATALVNTLNTITANVASVDYIVLLAGHNDANPDLNGGSAVPIGENTDMVKTTFKGALNVTITTLLNKYPTAKMLFLTPFNRRGIEEPYVEAMKEICGIWCVPCFDNYHGGGICFQNSGQAGVYELSNSLHLNEAGQERISELYESLLANNLPITYSLGGEAVAEDSGQGSGAQFTIVQIEKSAFEALTTKSASTVYLVNGYGVFVGATCIVSSDMMDSSTEEPDPEATLVSISAIYGGGEVPVGTSVTSLTGLTVIATYSDGGTATVTDYTLTGTIAEGNNTITVSYSGKTTTFTVTGVAEEVEPDEPTVNDYTLNPVSAWQNPGTASMTTGAIQTNRAASLFILQEWDRVNFVDSNLWNTYKYAIGLGDNGTSTTWLGGGYQTGELTITTGGTHTVMVARQDNANIDEAEMAVIANSFGYIRSGIGDAFQTETITDYDTIQGYPAENVGEGFTETTNGATTIYCEVNPGDYYEVSRARALSANDRFRFAFSATEPKNGVATMTYFNYDGLTEAMVLAPTGTSYLMVYVGGTTYPTIPDGFTIVRKYK